MPRETLLAFPCTFPIKAFGAEGVAFEHTVFTLVQTHVPELSEGDMSCNPSRRGNYLAVTAHIVARSQAQLDAIYRDLSACDAVLLAL